MTLEPPQAGPFDDPEPAEPLRHPLRQILLNELTRPSALEQASAAWSPVLSKLLSGAAPSALEALLQQGCKAATAASSRPWVVAHEHFALLFAEAPFVKGMPAKEHQAAELLMGAHLAEFATFFPNVFFAYKGAGDARE